jgi:PKHD-type hydroxylase
MFVHVIKSLFSEAEAASIVSLAHDAGLSQASLVGGATHHDIRRAQIAWLDDEGSADWVMQRVMAAVAEANRETFHFQLEGFEERLQVAAYDANEEGHFDWHSDMGGGPLAARRKLTIVAQLTRSEQYEGGELQLNPAGRPFAASAGIGDAILFASFVLHRVTPVTAGLRHSLTCWVHGPEFT